jgi:hypothetical protein
VRKGRKEERVARLLTQSPIQGGNRLPLGHQEPISRDTQRGMMMKATPASPFKVTETNLLLEFLIVTLDTPAQLRGVDKVAERNVLRKRGEPIFAGLILAFRPLDQQPFLRRFLEFVVRSLANRLIVNPMGEVLGFIWCAIAGLFRSRVALQAEILVLRHQLNVLRRRSPKRVVLGNIDRLVF